MNGNIRIIEATTLSNMLKDKADKFNMLNRSTKNVRGMSFSALAAYSGAAGIFLKSDADANARSTINILRFRVSRVLNLKENCDFQQYLTQARTLRTIFVAYFTSIRDLVVPYIFFPLQTIL